MKSAKYFTILMAVVSLSTATSAWAQISTTAEYHLKTAGPADCKGGLHFGNRATSLMQIGCIVKDFSGQYPDTPHSADYKYHLSSALQAVWSADPNQSLEARNGFIPIRMDDITAKIGDFESGTAIRNSYVFSGIWVTSNGSEERKQSVVIGLSGNKDGFFINTVTYPTTQP